MVIGIYPALQSSRTDLVDALKEGGRGSSGTPNQQRFRKLLVAAQVALSITLLAGAALLITSFVRLSQQNIGFHPEHRWIGFITLPEGQYPDQAARERFVEKMIAALRRVPAFESSSISADIPLIAAAVSNVLYARPDRELLPIDKRAAAVLHNIAPDYFKTWGISILSGRDFNEHDTGDAQNVMIISQAGAKKVFGDEDPIGKTLLVGSASVPCQIVGVAADVRSRKVGEPDDIEIYRPWAQQNFPFPCILVRSELPPDAVTKLAQSALASVDSGLAIAIPQSMDAIVAQALGQTRLMMWLLGLFATVALLLATIGIYGAVAYTVEQRTGEIGIRMALGAQARDVLALIVTQGMRPVMFGLGVGVAAITALGRLIASQLYQTSAQNPLLLASTITILSLAALLACVLPARRASRIDPIVALRVE
jgi:putative ABC transport system permease protein